MTAISPLSLYQGAFHSSTLAASIISHLLRASGMAPLIRAVLSALVGEEDAGQIEIISNDVEFDADGKWHIKYRHPSRYASTVYFKQSWSLQPAADLGMTSLGQFCRTATCPTLQPSSSSEMVSLVSYLKFSDFDYHSQKRIRYVRRQAR